MIQLTSLLQKLCTISIFYTALGGGWRALELCWIGFCLIRAWLWCGLELAWVLHVLVLRL